MRSPSIEWLHAKLGKQIRLTESFTEIEGLEFILKACRLKPYDYMFDERSNKITLYKWWFDEFGNSFTIVNSKKTNITYNDLRLDKERIVSTDLYYGLTVDNVAKMSKMVHLIIGKDEDLYQDCCLMTFLGIDDHLRSYLYWYGEWQAVSPLLMGLKSLKQIAGHLDIKYYLQIENKENSAIPCISERVWLSCLPAGPSFLSEIDKQSEAVASVLKHKGILQ